MLSVFFRFVLVIFVLSAPSAFAAQYTLNSVTVMNLSPSNDQIMVKLPNNKISVVKVGHFISGTRAKLSKVFIDRALVEATIEKNGETIIKKYWVYKAKSGKSLVELAHS